MVLASLELLLACFFQAEGPLSPVLCRSMGPRLLGFGGLRFGGLGFRVWSKFFSQAQAKDRNALPKRVKLRNWHCSTSWLE